MEFIDDPSVPEKFLIAFVVALAMLGIGGYLMRRIRPARTEPRLAVIDGASVGARRRLVLVQREPWLRRRLPRRSGSPRRAHA
jgi:flagellar biogenesis protein FliO